ncbi:hypothetical protein O6H91_16G062600 [Diphasiastrum complanatum]|uniref:Uncharacterized protein n=2 Tax=Diphasiastrum complanatum TaxID=34168 RepID=A0ACC2BCV8_DIPCM|nr:hypothetical protein O6H91_16G062600 [Diphasiastrum complanatum]KAJ7527601.1 hypothetical protein O6H91_16G062600 [Diphasiastrum complanatum]
MASTSNQKSGGLVWTQSEACKMLPLLLGAFNFPKGILPLQNVIELGYVKATGYMWIVQQNKIEHEFEAIGKVLSYSTEVSGYLDMKCIKKLDGVKAKELLYAPPILEISVDGSRVIFKSSVGLCRAFPSAAFN